MKIISCSLVMLLVAVLPAAAQQAAPSTTVKVIAPSAEPQPVMDFKMTAEGNVSLDFRDADIKNVLKVLAYKSGMNIIAGPEVVGQVNIQLKNVPWQKAMEVILSTYGYSYEQRGTVLMVTTVENLKKRREDSKSLADQEPLSTQTFVLNFSKAEDVVKTLDKMKTARGSVNFDQRTNSVIVTDVGSNAGSLAEVVKKLDAVTPQVLIEARIVQTTLGHDENMGLDLPTAFGGKIVPAGLETTFPWKSPHAQEYLPTQTYASNTLKYGTISLDSLGATLDMLKRRSDTKMLSSPRIVTLDNQSAKILVGSKYPLPKYTYSDTQDKLTISGWEYIDFGLTFNVTPHINGKNIVTLDIEPTIVDQSSTVAFDFGGTSKTDIPVLSTDSAKTNVMIKDGETLVIAGLIRDKKEKTETRFPILGDIPFLGAPFRHVVNTVTKTELVIFLTPHIITPDMTEAELPAAVVPAKEEKK